MTKQEASEKYQIPISILDEYEKWNLCDSVEKVMGAWQYDDRDIERLSVIMTLHNIGFCQSEISDYMNLLLSDRDTNSERLAMLNQKRSAELDEIHFKEAQLEQIDYLRHQINKHKKEL